MYRTICSCVFTCRRIHVSGMLPICPFMYVWNLSFLCPAVLWFGLLHLVCVLGRMASVRSRPLSQNSYSRPDSRMAEIGSHWRELTKRRPYVSLTYRVYNPKPFLLVALHSPSVNSPLLISAPEAPLKQGPIHLKCRTY